MLQELAVAYATTFALSAARVGGFVVASPLPGEHVPQSARLGLALTLAAVVTPLVNLPHGAPPLDLTLAIPAASEVGIGVLIGLAFRFVLAAAEVLGGSLSHAVGLGMPSIYNPSLGAQDTALGQLTGLFVMLFALSVGAHRVALAYLLESFRALPVGGVVHLSRALPVMVELAGAAIATGTRLAMPVIAVALAVQLALALLARAAPSMQLFSVGFSVLLLTGFATIVASVPSMGRVLAEHLSVLASVLDRLLTQLAPWG